jgi:carbamoyl-phosphate synthase large subunit
MLNILVLGISGNVSFGIMRVLRKNFPESKIIGSCINSSLSNYFCDHFIESPLASSENFLKWLVETCNAYNINIVFSGVEEIINVIAVNKLYVEGRTKACFTFSNDSCLKIGNSKLETVKWLRDNDFYYPDFTLIKGKDDVSQFFNFLKKPIILKPIVGKGSSGIFFIRDVSEIDDLDLDFENYIAQEMIGSNLTEYTVGCYQSLAGKVIDPIVMRRELHNGHTIKSEIVINDSLSEYCKDVTKKFQPFGPLNIQLRLDEKNNPVIFEFNVRFSGTTLIRDFFGFKDVYSILNEKLYNIFDDNCFNYNKSGVCIRMLDEYFYDNFDKIKSFKPFHYE